MKHLWLLSPVQKTRSLIREFKTVLTSNHQFVLAGKGIERESGSLLHEIFEEELGTSGNVSILSGPTFALEVARKKPTAAVIASANPELGNHIQDMMHGPRFRPY